LLFLAGKPGHPAALTAAHTSCREGAFAARTSAAPPWSWSWRGTGRAMPPIPPASSLPQKPGPAQHHCQAKIRPA